MQAAWGQENGAPTPARGAELYGEVGHYVQSQIESVPWYLTRAEKANKNVKKWDEGVSTFAVQTQTTKRPAQMDVVPQGVKVTTRSMPGKMTMADHDKGTVWPPPKGNERALPFMAMVNKTKDGNNVGAKDHRGEVNGIMIGYQGHVPRARDKIGSCPLGQVPAFRNPNAPSLSSGPGYVQTSKSIKGEKEPPLYVSEAHDPQLKNTFKPGQRIHASMDPNDDYKGGVPPGYAGHVHAARFTVGQSVYSTADTYGHADSQGATAKQFSSHNDSRGATYDDLANIYGNGFVADGIIDDPRDAYIMQGTDADWIHTDDVVSNKLAFR